MVQSLQSWVFFFSWERTAVEQRQLIGGECSQVFNLHQTLITDARGQHIITSTPAFDVIVHPAHIYTRPRHLSMSFLTPLSANSCRVLEVVIWSKTLERLFSQGLGTLTGIITIIMDLIYGTGPVANVRLKCSDLFIYIAMLIHRAPRYNQPKIFGMYLFM